MENLNAVNDAQAQVVDVPQNTGLSDIEQAQSAGAAVPPITDYGKQTKAENAKFADLRKKYEQDLKSKEDLLAKQNELVKKAGYDSVEEMVDTISADQLGMSLEEYREQKQSEAEETRKIVESSEEYQSMKAQLEALKSVQVQNQMSNDLKRIREIYPQVKSFDDLGDVFTTLLANGTEPLKAAKAAMAIKPAPPSPIGTVGEQEDIHGAFYTDEEINYYDAHPAEVQKMSRKNFERLIQSISRKEG